MNSSAASHEIHAEHLTLLGGVQGIGLRPAIARLALELRLAGTVCNAMRGVVVELEGDAFSLEAFASRLRESLPEHSQIVSIEREVIEPLGHRQFSIEPSPCGGQLQTAVPVDLRICDQCLAEVCDPSNRRYHYAFTSCTDCGPRYSVMRSMPYDRQRTSMDGFTMCADCQAEYLAPRDRRFHSQSNCCAVCGPRIWFSGGKSSSSSAEALEFAVNMLRSGGILALKGLGGYQLLCNATSEDAVRRMRMKKLRLTKPLAIMVGSLEHAGSFAILSRCERQAIDSRFAPIVLLEAVRDSILAQSIHPGLNTVGVLLPTTALHALLSRHCGVPLVVTSGNIEGEPLVYQLDEAEERLVGIADGFLHHDREIVQPVDDSVVRCLSGRTVTMRAARGLTPLVADLNAAASLLAVGGQQKVSVALSNGFQTVLGPYHGDLATVASRERFERHTKKMQALYACRPRAIVHDMHPDYFSTRWAIESGEPCVAVQHHHAHVVAGMLEHGWLDQTVLGIALDGTGWGPGGLILGGEILLASATECARVGSLRPFPLFGGEAAIREPQRVAMALLRAALDVERSEAMQICRLHEPVQSFDPAWLDERRISPLTTSAGRLFDGVAAIALGDFRPSFEGELAMRWEALCDPGELGAYPFSILADPFSSNTANDNSKKILGGTIEDNCSTLRLDRPLEIDWRPMIRAMYLDRKRNVPNGTMAMRFHRGLAQAIDAVAQWYPEYRVVLSGGVFQNRVLVELLDSLFAAKHRTIGWPERIPPNDGGLSIGQLAVAAARYRRSSPPEYGSKQKEPSCA